MKNEYMFVVVDPQYDFCNTNGSLYIDGAENDMLRLTTVSNRVKDNIISFVISYEDHPYSHINHPMSWINPETKENPKPFTIITKEDVLSNKWKSSRVSWEEDFKNYIIDLESLNRYNHCIYPYHCVTGTIGQTIVPHFLNVVHDWQEKYPTRSIRYVRKGHIAKREHYSMVGPEVPYKYEHVNMDLVRDLLNFENYICFAGQASSHCVPCTILDIIDNIPEQKRTDFLSKCIILKDCMSPVKGFEDYSKKFFENMYLKNVRIINSSDL